MDIASQDGRGIATLHILMLVTLFAGRACTLHACTARALQCFNGIRAERVPTKAKLRPNHMFSGYV